ncbi:MAG: LacI family transcriptional regulator [Armatimonadota bacterium]|nr:MAG: LacI family transcriptional regulator [Armatimonadota bacterium]
MKWNCLVLAMTAAAAALVAGCGKQQESSSGGGSSEGKRIYNIGFSQCNLGEPWRVQMNADIKAAAEKHKDRIRVFYKDAQNRTEVQQNQVREFIQQGVDLIIISPKESVPLTKPVAEAMAKGIPVIVLDRALAGDDYTMFIGGDNREIGRQAGYHMVKILGGKGNVVELKGLMTSQPAIDRHEGFLEGIKGSDIKIIFSADCKWLEPDAQREMKSALSRFPDIDAVYAHNDPSAHGAYLAAQQEGKGREKTIKFIGIDGLPTEGVKYVREGILDATFVYPTCGAEAIEYALKILDGEEVPKQVILPTRAITKETLEREGS